MTSATPTSSRRPDVLPDERVPPIGHASLWLTIVATLCVVALCNAIAFVAVTRVPINRGYGLVAGKWRLLERAIDERSTIDTLIVGDSSSNQGLNPAVIERDAGRRAINLGTIATGLTASPVWQVREYLERGVTPPREIWWMHVYDIWSREDETATNRLMGIASALPASADAQIVRGPRLPFSLVEMRAMRWLPLWSQNGSLQTLIRRPAEAATRAREGAKFGPDGFTAEREGDPRVVARNTKSHARAVRSGQDFRPRGIALEAVAEMDRVADARGVDVWLVESPLNATLWADAVFRKRWREVHVALRRAVAKTRRIRLVFDDPPTFADDRMQNSDHLTAEAADEFTAIVLRRIAERRAEAATRPAPTTRRAKRR